MTSNRITMADGMMLHSERDIATDDAVGLVLVNSWSAPLTTWDGVRGSVRGSYEVVAYDPRGHGRSGRSAARPGIGRLRDDLVELCAALEPRSWVLVGASIGAAVAIEAVSRLAPVDQVGAGGVVGLVSIGGPGHWGTRIPELLGGFVGALRTDRGRGLDEMAAGMLGPAAGDGARQRLRDGLDTADPRLDRVLIEQQSYDPRPLLGRVPVPVRYVHGGADAIVPVDVAVEQAAAAGPAGAAVSVVPGAGHLVHVERPDAVAAAIDDLARSAAAVGR